MATDPLSLPLHEKTRRKNTVPRAVELVLLFLLLSLIVYRICSLHHHGFQWLLALLCESWFAFNWALVVSIKWTQFDYKTYPQRLLQRVTELPRVDMFVTTADPILEPPILTVNTVLSLLAVDYPANKLACYVSDDGCSPLTFYSLIEASKFANLWVPFCKKYEVPVRAPFRYFTTTSSPSKSSSIEFQEEWKRMKDEYEELCKKIEKASKKSWPCDLTGEFAVFADVDRKNHPTIIKFMGRGIAGAQGPFYVGTGCFHRRKVIYGLSPDEELNKGKLGDAELQRKIGRSIEYTKSVAQVIFGSNTKRESSILSCMETATQVAGCGYEYGTSWGKEVGWLYGSTSEDILTGLTIHGRGWRSEYLPLEPKGFLGCAPSGGPASTTQMKRWSSGLLEILFSSKSPFIATLSGKLHLRQCLAYLSVLVWGLRSIPEISYAILPAYCIITNSSFLPKFNEHAILLPIAIFAIYNLYTLAEYLRMGLPVRAWWNNQRMWRVTAMTAWLFGLLSVILKLLGLSQTVFEVTQKTKQITKMTTTLMPEGTPSTNLQFSSRGRLFCR